MPLLICPCYQIFAAVLDSGESARVTRFSLQLLRSLGPRPSHFRPVLCLSQTFSFVSLTDMLLRSLGPGSSPFRLPSHDGINVNSATYFHGVVTEKLPAMPHTSWAELDIVFVVKMLYFCLRFSKISFYQTVLLSISAEGRLIGWVLIPLAKRPSSHCPASFRASTCMAAELCSLGSPQTQKPYSRAVLLLVCLCYQTSALVTIFSPVATNCQIICPRYQILSHACY